MRKLLLLFLVLGCNILDPVDRQLKLSKNFNSLNLIKFNCYYISNSFYNYGNPYYNIFIFSDDGSITKYLSFSPYDSIIREIKNKKESFIIDRYEKDWRYSIQDSSITMEYIFRTPGRTLAYLYGKIDKSGKIFIDSSYIKLKGRTKTLSYELDYLAPVTW